MARKIRQVAKKKYSGPERRKKRFQSNIFMEAGTFKLIRDIKKYDQVSEAIRKNRFLNHGERLKAWINLLRRVAKDPNVIEGKQHVLRDIEKNSAELKEWRKYNAPARRKP